MDPDVVTPLGPEKGDWCTRQTSKASERSMMKNGVSELENERMIDWHGEMASTQGEVCRILSMRIQTVQCKKLVRKSLSFGVEECECSVNARMLNGTAEGGF